MFQLENVTGRPKVTNPGVIVRVEEITVTNSLAKAVSFPTWMNDRNRSDGHLCRTGPPARTEAATMAYLTTVVNELGPDTKEELIDVIITAWEGIKMSLMNKLVDSTPERLEEVMKNEGDQISH